MPSANKHLQLYFFFGLLLAVLYLTFLIFEPYFITLGTAATLAVVMHPIYNWLKDKLGNRQSTAAALTVLFTVVVVLFPLTLIGTNVVSETRDLYARITSADGASSFDVLKLAEAWIDRYVPQLDVNLDDLNTYLRQGLAWVVSHIGTLFTATLQTMLQISLGLIAFFYLLRDGDIFIKRLISLSPLADSYDHRIFNRLEKAINSIVKGSLLVALLQGISSGIGYTIFGVPSPTLWALTTAFGALVPGVGTAIVIIPAVLFLFFSGHTGAAIGMAVWGVVAVGLIDNFIGPILVGRGVRIHPLLVLFAVIGGVEFFGPLGIVLGPLTLSLLYALLDIYRLFIIRKDKLAS